MPRPIEFPEWADGGSATIVEPSAAKKLLGWIVEKPPFEFFNWWMNLAYLWFVYLDGMATSNQNAITAETTRAEAAEGTNSTNISNHIAATAAHGATGAVAGTGNSQTFTGVNEFDQYTLIKSLLASGVPTPAAGKIAIFLDSADGQYKKKDSTGAVTRFGSGGGSSYLDLFAPDDGTGAIETRVGFHKALTFAVGQAQKVVGLVKVPSSYVAGSQITMKLDGFTLSTTGASTKTLAFTASLVRDGVDPIGTTTNQNTGSISFIPQASGNVITTQTINLSDSTGKINAVAVSPGDEIEIILQESGSLGTEDFSIRQRIMEVSFGS